MSQQFVWHICFGGLHVASQLEVPASLVSQYGLADPHWSLQSEQFSEVPSCVSHPGACGLQSL
jgi:hypothetical protein